MSIIPAMSPVLYSLVPAALRNDIASFVLYDNHPRNKNRIDITICTKSREVKEFHQRDLISSIRLDTTSTPTQINIYRNRNAELFYLIQAGHALIILSRKEKLQLHKMIANVEKYDVDDVACKGYGNLRVFLFDDAVPLLFDDNIEMLQDTLAPHMDPSIEPPLQIHIQLQQKLTEAKYSVQCNEELFKKLLSIHHLASYTLYEKNNANIKDSLFKYDFNKKISGILKVKTHVPWIKTCNGKIAIAFDVVNENIETLDDVQILLHGTLQPSVVYTTKVFVQKDTPPYWIEENTQNLKPNIKSVIIVVMGLKELKYNTLNRIELNGCIFYRKMGEKYLLPFDNTIISSSEIMKEELDVLSDRKLDDPRTILALLATTKRTELMMRHIETTTKLDLSIIELFCKYLQMEYASNTNNIIIHRVSPYHILHGIMIIFPKNCKSKRSPSLISVYTRSPSQVLALIHFIHDAIPSKIIITTPEFILTSKVEEFSHYNEEKQEDQHHLKYNDYASSVLNRTDLVLQYLDDSMIRMNDSKNPMVQKKIGKEIDLLAGGIEKYLEFRNKIIEEGSKSIERLIKIHFDSENESNAMIID